MFALQGGLSTEPCAADPGRNHSHAHPLPASQIHPQHPALGSPCIFTLPKQGQINSAKSSSKNLEIKNTYFR